MSKAKQITPEKLFQEARKLLDNLQIDFERLQEKKQELYPELSDAQFARLLGVTPATYSDYKNKKSATPSLNVALKAAIALGMDLRSLVPKADQIETFFIQNLR